MSKNTNLSFLTDYITADITNGRIGINNASPTVAFDVVGATKITGVLTLTSTISNGTYAYTLPSATGTLALTSALSGYLPLTGGTLTGALGGTSASFSSSVTATNITNNGIYYGKANASFPTTSLGYFALKTNNLDAERGGLTVQVSNSTSTFIDALSINYTGAATFSSSVTAGGTITSTSSSGVSFLNGNITTNNAYIRLVGSAHGFIVGREGSAGGQIFTGASAYASVIGSESTDPLQFATNNTVKMTITSAGNVGIGTITSAWGSPTTGKVIQIGNRASVFSYNNSTTDIANNLYFNGSDYIYIETAFSTMYRQGSSDGTHTWFTAASGTAGASVPLTERMRITSGGILLVGTTTATGLTTGSSVNVGISLGGGIIASQVNNNSNQYWSKATGYTSGDFTAHFVNTTYVGGISTNGSTTNYAVASDYRLKEDLKDFVGIDLINRIKAYDYQWKSDKTRMYGVVAHEFAEVLSYAVTGQKDEERMQGVDYSKLVPVLVKAVQELSAEITILKNK